MRTHVVNGPAEVARMVASILLEELLANPCAAVALPTGRTPLPLYKYLASLPQTKRDALAQARWFALDEFVGDQLPLQSTFRHFLLEHFVGPLALGPDRLESMSCHLESAHEEAESYERRMASAGGLALAILGIGGNGHIAFNEPGTAFDSRTGVIRLTAATRLANGYLFENEESVPTQGLTMGIGTILESRRIILLATGESKAEIIGRLLSGDSTTDLPASALKLHRNCDVIVDRDAAGQ